MDALKIAQMIFISLIKTNSEVEPAEMNGSGNPVGGIEPLNISYCTIYFLQEKRANLLLYFSKKSYNTAS